MPTGRARTGSPIARTAHYASCLRILYALQSLEDQARELSRQMPANGGPCDAVGREHASRSAALVADAHRRPDDEGDC